MTELRDAIDYFEQEWQLNGRSYLWDAGQAMKSRPVMLAAARNWLALTETAPSDFENPRLVWIDRNISVYESDRPDGFWSVDGDAYPASKSASDHTEGAE